MKILFNNIFILLRGVECSTNVPLTYFNLRYNFFIQFYIKTFGLPPNANTFLLIPQKNEN